MSHPPYTQLLAIKQWADRGLYDAVCRQFDQLSHEDATLMLRVLDHVHTVDRIFQHHLQGLPHPFAAPRSEKLPELSTLAQHAQQVDDWYVSYAQTVTQAKLDEPLEFTFTSGKPARMRRGEILLHVCLHGTYLSGIVACNRETTPMDATAFEAELRQVFRQIERLLAACQARMVDVIELQMFHVLGSPRLALDKAGQLAAIARVRDEFFPAPYPVAVELGVAELNPEGGLVEIKAVAYAPLTEPK